MATPLPSRPRCDKQLTLEKAVTKYDVSSSEILWAEGFTNCLQIYWIWNFVISIYLRFSLQVVK